MKNRSNFVLTVIIAALALAYGAAQRVRAASGQNGVPCTQAAGQNAVRCAPDPVPPAEAAQIAAPPPPPVAVPVPPMPQETGETVLRQIGFRTSGENGWLGVELKDVTVHAAQEFHLPGQYGALVESVGPNSPAAKAGLEQNDVILKFAGIRVWSVAQLARWVRETPVGRPVELEISRHGKIRRLSATIGSRPGPVFRAGSGQGFFRTPDIAIPPIKIPQFDLRIFEHGGVLGISGDDLTPQLAAFFGVKEGKGVLVREVIQGSAAEKAGLKAGDVIVKLNSQPIASVMELRTALMDLPAGAQKVTLTVVRNHREKTLAAEIESRGSVSGPSTSEIDVLGMDPRALAQFTAHEQATAAMARQYAARVQDQVRAQLLSNQGLWQKQMQAARQQMREAERALQKQKFYLQRMKRKLAESSSI